MIKKNDTYQAVLHGKGIEKARLKKYQYTISLLNEAYSINLIDLETMHVLQYQIMNLLKDLILRYTGGESTSVSNDTAESLLCSLLYAIDACTSSFSSPEEAVRQLKEGNIAHLYNRGLEQIVIWFNDTRELYNEIRKEKLDIRLEAYNLTITEAVPLFLKNYNMVFFAHHAMGSIDYPLIFDDMSLQGVLYFKNYLQNFRLETSFCKYFNEEEINRLLENYQGLIRMDYKIELINVFELVFNNAIFSIIAEKPAFSLLISKNEHMLISQRLCSMSCYNIYHEIDASIQELIKKADISSPDIIDYINRYKVIFIKRVIGARDNNTLGSLIITEQQDTLIKSRFSFETGERMTDADFNILIKKLKRLLKTKDKIKLILSKTSSLYDFLDILISDCFFGHEYYLLFDSLENMELSFLSKEVFYQELRDGFSSLDNMLESYGSAYKNEEYDWQKCFVEFLRNLPDSRARVVERYIAEVEYEEIKLD